MTVFTRVVGGVVIAALSVCAHANSAPAPTTGPSTRPATTQPAGAAKADEHAGTITTVLADKQYAAVKVPNVKEWKLNDGVVVTDEQGRTLAEGEVRAIVKDKVHIKYEPTSRAPRKPAKGDRVSLPSTIG